ncbi:MAG: phosphoribosylglycinamide formyltransferase [Endomicrobium sp.]|jgi:phosphoribosylglycinamide formyltransferase-1|nr:phosphoribosylglycinamide formyltransferase [Endomicrobium sp.]
MSKYSRKSLAVLVSGYGSNMQSIVDSTKDGLLKGLAEVVLVVSSNSNAYAIERAKNEHIKAICVESKKFKNEKKFTDVILDELQNADVDLICLAGYMSKIGVEIIRKYDGRILNIHPALLPKFGGKGMYGRYVHEAVIKSGDTKSGATVHFVDENYDTGRIILQQEVNIFSNDSPRDVAKKVMIIECKIYPKAIKKVIEEDLKKVHLF